MSWKAPSIAIALVGAAALCEGCKKGDDPVTAYTALATSVEKGEYRKAYDGLSTPTRELLASRARALNAASDGGIKDDPVALFFSAGTQVAVPESVQAASDGGSHAVLHVRSRRGTQDLSMVKEEAGWKLDLTEALHE